MFLLVAVLLGFSSCVKVKEMVVAQSLSHKTPIGYEKEVVPQLYSLKKFDVVEVRLTLSVDQNSVISLSENGFSRVNQDKNGFNSFTINNEGKIELPEIGFVEIAGLNLYEATEKLREACNGYIINPVVEVRLANYNVKVLGEVNIPGSYNLQNGAPTLLDAIAAAQGLTAHANRKNIQIIRTLDDKVSINYVDLTNPNLFESDYYYLKPNDVVVLNANSSIRLTDNTITYTISGLSALAVILNILTR